MHKVDIAVEDMGETVMVYADPDTLRAIADDLETRGIVSIEGRAIDLDQDATIEFHRPVEEV